MATYEEKMVIFAEEVLNLAALEKSWYQTPSGHMRTVSDPRFQYSTTLRFLRDAAHLEIDIEEVQRRYADKIAVLNAPPPPERSDPCGESTDSCT